MERRIDREAGRQPESREKKPWFSEQLGRKLRIFFIVNELFSSSAQAQEVSEPALQEVRILHAESRGESAKQDKRSWQKYVSVEEFQKVEATFFRTVPEKDERIRSPISAFANMTPEVAFNSQVSAIVFAEFDKHSPVDGIIALDELYDQVEHEDVQTEEGRAAQQRYLDLIELKRFSYTQTLKEMGVRDIETLVEKAKEGPLPKEESRDLGQSELGPMGTQREGDFSVAQREGILRADLPPTPATLSILQPLVRQKVDIAVSAGTLEVSFAEETYLEGLRYELFERLRAEASPTERVIALDILATEVVDLPADSAQERATKNLYRTLLQAEQASAVQESQHTLMLSPALFPMDIERSVRDGVNPEQARLELSSDGGEWNAYDWNGLLVERRRLVRARSEHSESEAPEKIAEIDRVLERRSNDREDAFRAYLYNGLLDQVTSEYHAAVNDANQAKAEGIPPETETLERIASGKAIIEQTEFQRIHLAQLHEGISSEFQSRESVHTFDQLWETLQTEELTDDEEGRILLSAQTMLEEISQSRVIPEPARLEAETDLFRVTAMRKFIREAKYQAEQAQETFALRVSEENLKKLLKPVVVDRDAAEFALAKYQEIEVLRSMPGLEQVFSSDTTELIQLQSDIAYYLEGPTVRENAPVFTGEASSEENSEDNLTGIYGQLTVHQRKNPDYIALQQLLAEFSLKRVVVEKEVEIVSSAVQEALQAFEQDLKTRYATSIAE